MSSSLSQILSNSLWFAFDALDQHKTGVVDKARLKELTKQIGETFFIDRPVENCLADYRSTDTLTFDQFLHFLEYEVFSDICKGSIPYSEVERYHALLDALFWDMGRHSLAPRYPAVLSSKDTFKVFRIFCMLADRTAAGGDLVQVSVRRSEVCEVCRHLVDGLGLDWDWSDWQMMSGAISSFPLPVFLTFLEGRYAQNAEPAALSASVEIIYKFFVGQVFFHGKAYQRITRAGGWLRRDIEVVPWGIRSTMDTNEDCPEEQGTKPPTPKKISSAVGRSLTLGRNAVGVMGGAVKTGVTEVVERSRTLTRGTSSPAKKETDETDSPKRGFSLGRWGSISGINKKKNKAAEKDTASLGGRESPSPGPEKRRSHTLERTPMRSSKSSSTLDTSSSSAKSPGQKVTSPKPLVKESTKGVVGGVIGKVWRLDITPDTTVTSLKDSSSSRPCQISIVSTPTSRPIVIAASDHKSKARLVAALQEAIKHCTDCLPYQMRASEARRADEEAEELKASEEKIRRSSQADIIEQTQAELAAERTAREEAESLAQSEAVARAAEGERVQELTVLRQQLEALLEQEKQAKNDEEIVRNLQARVLREEWAKREELERLQQEQQQLLEEEQRKRKAFEILQQEQEKKLKEAEMKLKSLDSNRRRLDEELRAAREKIVMSGRGKQLLEAKMKVQEGRRPPIRTLSLKPSRQERSSPARSSSFTTPPTRLGIPSPTAHSKLLPGQDDGPSAVFSEFKGYSPGHSNSSTPATTPSGASANRTLLDSLVDGKGDGNTNSATSSPIRSIPEQKFEEEEVEPIGWKIPAPEDSPVETNHSATAENGDSKHKNGDAATVSSDSDDGIDLKNKYIEIKTYEEKKPMPVDLIGETNLVTKTITSSQSESKNDNFDLLSEIDSLTKPDSTVVITKTVTTTDEDGDTRTETVVTESNSKDIP